MRKILNKITSFIICICIIFPCFSVCIADEEIKVNIDSSPVSFDVPPSMINNRTMVPMRAIFEALGARVTWDESTATAAAVKDDTEIRISIGDNRLIKNGETIYLDVPAVITDNRTLVPIRAVSEAFGYLVEWVEEEKTVEIYTDFSFFPSIPEYSGSAYSVINNNIPFFSEEEYTLTSFESYSELDYLGRCQTAYANLCIDTMPTEKRGSIGQIKPTGWHTVKYDFISGKYLYNRCHLIGYQLSAENANRQNLITGTRYLNTEGMLPFENMTADYIKETGNHVLYRVTPVYDGENLLADGVLMEAYSVEDGGDGICFNVFCYNVQPGVEIDYKTGDSRAVYEN